MRKSTALIPLALLAIAAFPVAAQEMPRVLFCMGQCFGVDEAGQRVPVTKGTRLAPGLRLETGPDSYAQVKIGADTACGIGERSRVRFDHRVLDRDVVILDEGRIRLIGGEAIGRPGLRPVELQTADGKFDLRSADIEVKTLPKTADAPQAPTLVKLNVGEARLGDIPMTKEAVQGVVGGQDPRPDHCDWRDRPADAAPRGRARQDRGGDHAGGAPAVRSAAGGQPAGDGVQAARGAREVLVGDHFAGTRKSALQIESPTLSKLEVSTVLVSDPTKTIKPYVTPVAWARW